LTEDQRKRFQEGIALFNRGHFFDCHEALEEVWLQSYGDRKKFLQGLIQVAVALHHLRNGNLAGAQRLLAAAVEKLSGPVPDSETIGVDALLAALAAHPGLVFTRAQLLAQVWGDEYYDDHVVDVHVSNLRRKLQDDPTNSRYIQSVRGVGYRFGGQRE